MSDDQLRPARWPRTVVFGRSTRSAARSAALWGLVFGAMVASSALSYTKIYDTEAKRAQLALLFGANHATTALFGPGTDLQTVAGFTAYKVSMTLWITGAIWGILLATRLLRGEEESGRAELSLVGRSSLASATAQSLAGVAIGLGVLWALTAALSALTGHSSKVGFSAAASLFFAAAMVAPAAVFAAVAAVTSQLFSSRRRASSTAALVLGISYALRMVADSSGSLEWLRWLSPLGWVEQLSALTHPSSFALLPLGIAIIGLAGAAVLLAGHRDVGAGLLADRSRARPRLALLHSPLGLSLRLLRGGVLSWWTAIAVSALLMGFVARAAGEVINGGSLAQVMARFGATGSGAKTYLGLANLIIAVLVAFLAASQAVAMRGEEAQGRLEPLVSGPVDRLRWAGGRVAIAVGVLLVAGLLAGLATWLGTVLQGGGMGFGELLAAGMNTVAPALCVLGLSLAVFGLRPRRTVLVAWGLVAWSLMIEMVGGIGAISSSVVGTSVFHHMAPAPATAPDWVAAGVLSLIGVAAAAIGFLGLGRRDLAGG